MKTIHVLIAATALAVAPIAALAQSVPTTTAPTTADTTSADATATDATNATATDATGETDTSDGATQMLDPAAGTNDIGSTGTGTGTNKIGSTGTGTGTNNIGSTGTGTGTNNIGSTGTGTGTFQSAARAFEPEVSLSTSATALRTPGTVKLTVTLAADASLDPPQAHDVSVPLASSSASCNVPAAVTVAWTSTAGGSASVDVVCKKAGAQTVTLSSGAATASFTTR